MKFNIVIEVGDGSGYIIGWNVCRSYNLFRFSFGYLMIVFFFVDDVVDDGKKIDEDIEFSIDEVNICFLSGINVV